MSIKKSPETDALFRAIMSLKSIDECYLFFEDACTIKEIQDLSMRFLVAQQLDVGKNYIEVNQETGVSTATICRVNKCLNYGSGYRTVIDRLKAEENGTDVKV